MNIFPIQLSASEASRWEIKVRLRLRIEGRRPLLIHTDSLIDNDDINGFVVSTGEIIQHRLTPPDLDNINQIASAASRNNIGKTAR